MRIERSLPRLLDAASLTVIVLGTIALLTIDIRSPRGVIDGIGYPAVIALTARFGRRATLVAAAIISVLIVAGAFLSPPLGISILAEFANRFFALLSVWIVAIVLNQRFRLEQDIAAHQTVLAEHQQALLETVHRVLLVELPLRDRIRRLTEIAAKSLNVGRVGVFRWREDATVLECLDLYRHPEDLHEITPDMRENRHPDYLEAMRRELVVAADDVRAAPFLGIRQDIIARNNVGAVVGAGIFLDGKLAGQITFSHLDSPRQWSMQEIAYCRSLANIVSTLFSADRNSETLAALDLVSEGIYATAETGAILYANRAAREIAAQASQTDAASLPASAFPHPIRPLDGAMDEQEIVFGNAELEIKRTRLPRGGMITRINNVTARNAVAWESARLQKRLQQAAKMEAIGQLAGGIAHDFSNILSSIMGFARFLEEDLPGGSEEQSFAKRILASCERGKRLVDQILDFALTRAARQDSVDLGLVIHQCAEQIIPTLPEGIALQVTADEGMVFVAGSAVQLSQIVTNLCTNAADAMGAGGGKIHLELSRARQSELDGLAAGPGETWIGEVDDRRLYARVLVSDSGEGIAAQNIPRIFEPFFTTKGRQRGTGLGLAVVHGAVAAHQGICHVRSEPGVGTSMSIYLPLAEPKPDHLAKPTNAALSGDERVLLVDDEIDIVDAMSRGLSRLGYRAVGMDDPDKVIRAMEKEGTGWDVVITDQMMPALDGLELIQKIKALQPNLIAILCTGFGEAADEESARRAGADAYVRKPVDAEALARCIRRLQMERRPT